MDDPNELLSLDEAAKLIPGANADTLKRKARAGKLTVYRVGKSYCTTRADIRKLIEASRVEASCGTMISETKLSRLALDATADRLRKLPRKR